jgi:hypothetical protein
LVFSSIFVFTSFRVASLFAERLSRLIHMGHSSLEWSKLVDFIVIMDACVFPPFSTVESDQVPDGYPLIYPFYGQFVLNCLWLSERQDFIHKQYPELCSALVTNTGCWVPLCNREHPLVCHLHQVEMCQEKSDFNISFTMPWFGLGLQW